MIDVVVPQVGEATSEVVLVRWLKEEGAVVRKGEPLFELDTDKYVVEIEAFESGTLAEILVPAGTDVLPLQVVARLAPEETGGAEPLRPGVAPAAGERPREPASAAPTDDREPKARTLASPRARRLAAELGVELEGLAGKGSGPGGLVTAEDVAASVPTDSGRRAAGERRRPLSRRRRLVAERVQASKREVPHFYLLVDVDMGEAQRLRDHCAGALGWEQPPTVTDLVVAACARALDVVPEANVSYREGELVARAEANVGIAVDVEDGLVVPVLRDAGRLGLRELSEAAAGLVERAREGRLREPDVGGRSLVVSNLGMHGVDAFAAIIDVPDPMILAVGRLADRCVPVDGVPAIRPVCTLTLSVDHRAFDGVLGARFLGAVREALEHPFELLRV